jgi:hypothetical protein
LCFAPVSEIAKERAVFDGLLSTYALDLLVSGVHPRGR